MRERDLAQLHALFEAPEFIDAIDAAFQEEAEKRIATCRKDIGTGDFNAAAIHSGEAFALETAVKVLRECANKYRPPQSV